jgi:hypothetical protein
MTFEDFKAAWTEASKKHADAGPDHFLLVLYETLSEFADAESPPYPPAGGPRPAKGTSK